MTITDTQYATVNPFDAVTLDLYRDIHKGIRAELFAVTGEAGRIDPSVRVGRNALAGRVHDLVDLLVVHAEHEDTAIQPALELHLPDLAERVATDHETLEARMDVLTELADEAADATPDRVGALAHHTYLDLASFTSAYLAHQDVEERVIMPALERAVGFEAVLAMNQAIIASIPPDQMASSLALMLPAMNIDNRAELLGGMQQGAPPEVFEGVWGLAGSVLTEPDHRALAHRLGL